MSKPLLAITMGDPAGVGPETIVGAWAGAGFHDECRAVVVGRPEILRRAARLLNADVEVLEVSAPEEVSSSPTALPCLVCGSADADDVRPAVIDARGGQAAYDAIVLATELAIAGRVDGVVTAPISKAALWAAGYRYPGHTELLAELCGVNDVAMMLYLSRGGMVRGRNGLGVVHVTLHAALRDIFAHITTDNILAKIRLANTALESLSADLDELSPRQIAVCALNPHCGEQNLFGDEEERLIRPAVERARADGIVVSGPLASDSLMVRAAAGEFDAVVAMFHDQGHIALKLLGMHRAVNVTLGLPIIRTSVAHGTAFDVAWQGHAETSGMLEAVRVASRLAQRRMLMTTNQMQAPSYAAFGQASV